MDELQSLLPWKQNNEFSTILKFCGERGKLFCSVYLLTSEANIGRKIVAVATLEVNSVNVVIMMQTLITIA